jgi:hypothetical protein
MLTASSELVPYGGTFTLAWSSTNATKCTASGGWTGNKTVSGTVVVSDHVSSQTFTLTCTGKKGTAAQSVLVETSAPSVPSVTLTAVPQQVESGQNVTLNWTTQFASACTASDGWSGAKNTNGQQVVGPLDKNTLFTLICTGPGGATLAQTIVTVKSYFSEVVGASPEMVDVVRSVGRGTSILSTNVVSAKLDRSGRKGLVFHFYALENFGVTTDAPTPDRLVALRQQDDGTFRDDTAQLFGTADLRLGAASRKHRKADFNQDGLDDWAYTLNREDGRAGNVSSNVAAQGAVVTSTASGTYQVQRLGTPTWGHSVGLVERAGEPPDVAWSGYSGPAEAFGFRSGSWLQQSTDPALTANTFTFLPLRAGEMSSARWIGEPENYSLSLNIRSGSGSWSEVSRVSLGPIVSVPGITYSGDPGPVNVLSYRGKKYTFGGFQESCSIRIFPAADAWALFWFQAAELPAGYAGGTVIQNDLVPTGELIAVSASGDQLTLETLVLDKPLSVRNANFFDCRDLDGDGYDDFVVYPYRAGGRPLVYLNDKAGGFRKVDDSKFPEAPAEWGESATALLDDLDGDGIPDLVLWPANGVNAQILPSIRFRVYKGLRRLD